MTEEQKFQIGEEAVMNDDSKMWCKGRTGKVERTVYNATIGQWIYLIIGDTSIFGWVQEDRLLKVGETK